MGELDSKTVVITGGSLGIGLAVAKRCATEGATVVIAARNKEHLSSALPELNKISNKRHGTFSLNVGDLDEVNTFAKWSKDNYDEINGLVNCAGVYGPIGKTTNVSMQGFAEAISINLLGTVYMCATFAPILFSKSRKKIVNYSGGGAASPFANYSAYATSKIAIVRFTENLSIELSKDGFDVNCVAPGFVATRLHEQTVQAGPELAGGAFYESTIRQVKAGGVPAEKAAALTIYLLSEESDGISGKFISAPWDPWQIAEFQELLRKDADVATLRRIDNKTFFKRP